jgi:hypothetical protein
MRRWLELHMHSDKEKEKSTERIKTREFGDQDNL